VWVGGWGGGGGGGWFGGGEKKGQVGEKALCVGSHIFYGRKSDGISGRRSPCNVGGGAKLKEVGNVKEKGRKSEQIILTVVSV